MPTKPVTHPIQTLREQATILEAAITLALADPTKEPVHRLRTSTRRIEAQLELLKLIPGLPPHNKPAKKIRKLLKKLRRSAGAVRDLDVQRSMLAEQADGSDSHKLGSHARHLRSELKTHRAEESDKLGKVLAKEQQKLAPALRDLLEILEPSADFALPSDRLQQLVAAWYERKASPLRGASDPKLLHATRKCAKLARYIAEPGSPAMASRFEAIQHAGGTWHDLLTLFHLAQEQLGDKSPLTQNFQHRQLEALRTYQSVLHDHKSASEEPKIP